MSTVYAITAIDPSGNKKQTIANEQQVLKAVKKFLISSAGKQETTAGLYAQDMVQKVRREGACMGVQAQGKTIKVQLYTGA